MNIRRHYTPGNIVFITQVVADRSPAFAQEDAVLLLRQTLYAVKALYPFDMLAYVFMPDHLHLLVRPDAPVLADRIMQSFKRNFTLDYKKLRSITTTLKFWQPRYWDHIIRSDEDLEHHLNYIHYNPVKHGYVTRPEAWRHTSYHWWQEHGYYPAYWGVAHPRCIGRHEFRRVGRDSFPPHFEGGLPPKKRIVG